MFIFIPLPPASWSVLCPYSSAPLFSSLMPPSLWVQSLIAFLLTQFPWQLGAQVFHRLPPCPSLISLNSYKSQLAWWLISHFGLELLWLILINDSKELCEFWLYRKHLFFFSVWLLWCFFLCFSAMLVTKRLDTCSNLKCQICFLIAVNDGCSLDVIIKRLRLCWLNRPDSALITTFLQFVSQQANLFSRLKHEFLVNAKYALQYVYE